MVCGNLVSSPTLQDRAMDEKKYEEIVYFVKHGNYSVCITRKRTDENVFKWLRKGRQMTSLRAYMQHLGVSKNGGKLPIETLQLLFNTKNMPYLYGKIS